MRHTDLAFTERHKAEHRPHLLPLTTLPPGQGQTQKAPNRPWCFSFSGSCCPTRASSFISPSHPAVCLLRNVTFLNMFQILNCRCGHKQAPSLQWFFPHQGEKLASSSSFCLYLSTLEVLTFPATETIGLISIRQGGTLRRNT